MAATPQPKLTPAESDLASKTSCVHINALLVSRIKSWASDPKHPSNIKEEVEKTLWERFGGKPSELNTKS